MPRRPVTDTAGQAVADDCGEPLYWEPSGTLQVCTAAGCPDRDAPVFPLSLTARGRAAADPRREATPDEQLGQALALAGRRRQLVTWIREQLGNEQLHHGTRGHLEEVFLPAIQQAPTLPRLDWLAERLFALPIQQQAAAPPVIAGEVIRDTETSYREHPAASGGPGLREFGRQALASLGNGTADGLASVSRAALPAAGQVTSTAYYSALGYCDRCAEEHAHGRHQGRFGPAVIRIEFRGRAGLQAIDGKPQPALCQGCWEWLQTTQPAGSYFITDRAGHLAPVQVRTG